ncbi:glycerol kinase [Thermocatellispora tengchongensis]|uniref:Glycerol kinase n=1 Tax=Thermocatellispora tengchongensis TaxID=1073253 RepID=A0A840PET2_9ACTN|nr:FGGY family carbohydrate kinase [Thermocatellispora tengchongensis]MBB5136443.1 glycerol kinase [Thermocatellispora tengchongensis]
MADTDPLVLAVDQGTSSTKALLVSGRDGRVVARGVAPLGESQPRPGWVEQSAEELWQSVRAAVRACLAGLDDPGRVAGIGLSTQRESMVLWERATGRPVGPLVSWQDQRTAGQCRELAATGAGELVRARSGMPLDPMFSALKARWLLDEYDPGRTRGRAGELCLGTVDSWLLSRFAPDDHVVEVGNASRTQLLNVATQTWDPDLLDLFGVPAGVLPQVAASSGPFPAARGLDPLPDGVPVLAVLGDSHAAMFAHGGWRPGVVKATYGTGSSVMAIGGGTGDSPGLCRSVAWDLGRPMLAVEGNIRATGRTLSWLADLFGVTPEALLAEAGDTPPDGVHFVPAFGGLGAPWWEPDAVALLSGLTLGTRRGQIVAAALESVAFQVEDVVAEVERATGEVRVLMADGGLTRNDRLMRLQAGLSGRTVARSGEHDLSALGAADAAGVAGGLWTFDDLEARPRPAEEFAPSIGAEERRARRAAWHEAIRRSRPGASTKAYERSGG